VKNKYKLLVGILGIIIILLIVFVLPRLDLNFDLFQPGHTDVFDAHVVVGDYIGFNNTNESLEFGTIKYSGGAQKKITVINNEDYPQMVRLAATGDIAPFVSVSDNLFVLQPGEERQIEVSLQVKSGTELGDYDGKFKVEYTPA